jgi:N-acyl-D-aspartate/D-glutamate deacylase
MFDIVIKGGRLADGSGRPAQSGDLAIAGGRIVEMGQVSGPARRTIDADGALVTPGFIDVHSHYDGQATWDDTLDPSFSNGVTTTVAGNCGVGFAPARPQDHDQLISVMEGVEAIPGIVLQEGVPWGWESFAEYMDFLGRRRYGLDIGVLAPHAPLRVYVMGERAVRHERATDADLAAMQEGVRSAMAAGAMGISAGRITEHRYGADMAYVPGTFAEHEEFLTLARAMAESGRGLFQVVPRGAIGGMAGLDGLSRDDRLAEHKLCEDIARATGRPVHYLLQQFDSDPDDWRMMLEATRRARADGLSIYAHISGRSFGLLSTLDGYHAFMARPAYREISHLPIAERAAAMREPGRRAAILAQADLRVRDGIDKDTASMVRLLNLRTADAYPFTDAMDYEPTSDETIGAMAAKAGVDPMTYTYDYLTAGDGGQVIAHLNVNFSNGDLDHAHAMLRDPATLSSLGDGGAHMKFICDASMAAWHLTFWARDRKRGPIFPVEEMVAKITRHNAQAMGLTDRGVLAVGKRADINVIDFDAMKLHKPQMVHDLPAGGGRFLQTTTGFVATLLNGEVTRAHDADTGARPGRLIRTA